MNTAVIITKTEPEVKKKAQALAKEFGMSLSSLVNAYLRQVIRTRKIELDLGEEPSEYLKRAMKRAEKDRKAGKGSPIFHTGEEAVKWLEEQGI